MKGVDGVEYSISSREEKYLLFVA